MKRFFYGATLMVGFILGGTVVSTLNSQTASPVGVKVSSGPLAAVTASLGDAACSGNQIFIATDQPAGQQLFICKDGYLTQNLTLGTSGALTLGPGGALDIVPSVVPTMNSANNYSGVNTFTGVSMFAKMQLAPTATWGSCTVVNRDVGRVLMDSSDQYNTRVRTCLLVNGRPQWKTVTVN
jgi:hypothetical protein